jgi:LmbE family N-acetylglucosaminyl deacetylase
MHLSTSQDGPLKILFLGAHCDDIEIGCGATILTLRDNATNVDIRWVTFSGDVDRQIETRTSAERFLGDHMARTKLEFCVFRESFFPAEQSKIKEKFEKIKAEFAPDLIFTHYRHDRHQDHRIVNELTWNTWRSHTILEYEIPKYDGDLGQPNVFMPLSHELAAEKAAILTECYASQAERSWFSADTFNGLMRIRGIESSCPEPMAEAFYGQKVTLRFPATRPPT